MSSNPALDRPCAELLAAILGGEIVDAAVFASSDLDALYETASYHDVVPLLAEALLGRDDLPESLRRRLKTEAQAAVVVDLLREAELRRMLSAMAGKGIAPLIIKGSHLAYSHYARPDLRARVDSDLMIPLATRDVVHDLLTNELGYVASAKLSGDLTATQRTYTKAGDDSDAHSLDVHWRLASPQVFAHVLSYDELFATSVRLPRLSASARAPSAVHALTIACVHRVAHHDNDFTFKWLYDVHLIASRLTGDEWRSFETLAVERRIVSVCAHTVTLAASLFGTTVPASIFSDPQLIAQAGQEQTAAYLAPRPQAQMVADDLRALGTWRDRLRLLREHLFPDAVYMRRMYAPASRAPLALLYVTRILQGAKRWIVGTEARR